MNPKYPLVELPKQTDLTLFLICAELKSQRLMQGLQQAGLDYSPFIPHLDSAILPALGLDDDRDATYDFYYKVIARHAKKIDASQESVTRQALKVYVKLVSFSRQAASAR
jgi:hypothetical protein